MLIVVEGPDCTGKSTFCAALADYLRYRWHVEPTVVHRGPPTGHPLNEYVLPLLPLRRRTSESRTRALVCDRWHLGEAVYPQVLGRRTRLDEGGLLYVEWFLRSLGAVLVNVTRPVDEIRRCVAERGDDLVSAEQAVQAAKLYHDVAGRTLLPTIEVEYGSATDPDTLAAICREAELHARLTEPLGDLTTYVGPPRPRVLLLGDRRGNAGTPLAAQGSHPAFLPYPHNSGRYLVNVLATRPRATLAGVGLANANDVDDVGHLYDALHRPLLVPLGRLAERRLARVGLPAARSDVPHPQYWKRFRHHEPAAYADLVLPVETENENREKGN